MPCLQPRQPLTTSRLLLRPISVADGLALYEYMKTDWYGLLLTGVPVSISADGVTLPWSRHDVEQAYQRFCADEQRAMFAIVLHDVVIGEVVLNDYDAETNSCNLRAYIAP